MKNGWLIILFVLVVLYAFMKAVDKPQISSSPTNQTKSLAKKKRPLAVIDKSEQTQISRKDLLEKLIAEGIFKKIEMPASLVHVWVDNQFLSIDYDAKQSFLEVVYCYFYDGKNMSDSVVLKDYLTGKRIGTYSPLSGLDLK